MAATKKTRTKTEFGDFQTPYVLAHEVCGLLARRGVQPLAVVEPTCGRGSFLRAVAQQFPAAARIVGLEINPSHAAHARAALKAQPNANRGEVLQADFFSFDWRNLMTELPEPILVIGNPPWVTNSELGTLGSDNLPLKSNFQNRGGLDAVTGKANFDISEWMLIKLLDSLDGREATLAMLCKTAVARKVVSHAWKTGISMRACSIHRIDAEQFFGALVDACLLVCELSPQSVTCDCGVYARLADAASKEIIGCRDGILLSDVAAYERWKHLRGPGPYRWRSGIKHDCSKVMELRLDGHRFRNALGEIVELEPDYLYPMLKSSEVANGGANRPSRYMLVTQRTVGEDTGAIEVRAPKTWQYLVSHVEALDRRASSIYRGRARFSVFGVGDYAFAPWKVAIAGLYKRLAFQIVGSFHGKPIVLDDTSYFIPCFHKDEAEAILRLLDSEPAREFLAALIFWDAKRPITVDVLKQLDLAAVAKEMNSEAVIGEFLKRPIARSGHRAGQRCLFGKG